MGRSRVSLRFSLAEGGRCRSAAKVAPVERLHRAAVLTARLAACGGAGARAARRRRRDRMAPPTLAQVGAAGRAGRRGGGDGTVALVHHVAGCGRGPGADVAVAMDSDERPCGRGDVARLGGRPLVAARAGGTFGAAVRVVRNLGPERLGRLFPHGGDRMESADGGAACPIRSTGYGSPLCRSPEPDRPRASWCP